MGLIERDNDTASLTIKVRSKQTRKTVSKGNVTITADAGNTFDHFMAKMADAVHTNALNACRAYFKNFGVANVNDDVLKELVANRIIEACTQAGHESVIDERIEELDRSIDWARSAQTTEEDEKGFVPYGLRPTGEAIVAKADEPYFPYPELNDPEQADAIMKAELPKFLDIMVRGALFNKVMAMRPECGLRFEDFGTTEAGFRNALRVNASFPMGMGKTTIVERFFGSGQAQAIIDSLPKEIVEGVALNVLMAAPSTRKAVESEEGIKEHGKCNVMTLRGVSQKDPEFDEADSDDQMFNMCRRSDLVSRMNASGYATSEACNGCWLASSCGYKAQNRKAGKLATTPCVNVFTGPHEFLHFPSPIGQFDMVICDENFQQITPVGNENLCELWEIDVIDDGLPPEKWSTHWVDLPFEEDRDAGKREKAEDIVLKLRELSASRTE